VHAAAVLERGDFGIAKGVACCRFHSENGRELSALALQNKRVLYDLLFDATAETLTEIAAIAGQLII
jgi:hypothetical protein